MEIGNLQNGTAVESTAQAPASSPERVPRPEERQGDAEVTISQEGRERNEQARAAAARNDELRERARETLRSNEQAAAEKEAVQPGVIAVRLGMGPTQLEQRHESSEPEEVVRQGLRERALIPQVQGLLEEHDDETETVTLPAQANQNERTKALGEDRFQQVGLASQEREFAPTPASADAFASRDAGTRDRAVAEALQRVETRSTERSDEPEDLDRATAVAPQVGPAPGNEDARRAEILGSDRRDDSEEDEERAREVVTLGGSVEADAADQLVTRFLNGRDREEAGPTPQAREELGERAGDTAELPPEE